MNTFLTNCAVSGFIFEQGVFWSLGFVSRWGKGPFDPFEFYIGVLFEGVKAKKTHLESHHSTSCSVGVQK